MWEGLHGVEELLKSQRGELDGIGGGGEHGGAAGGRRTYVGVVNGAVLCVLQSPRPAARTCVCTSSTCARWPTPSRCVHDPVCVYGMP